MRFIKKQPCPICLDRYRRSNGATYENMSKYAPEVKAELRTCLLTEQGYVCGYCGSKIDEEHSVIEHIKCQDRYPQLQLEYMNMICSCEGGQDRRHLNPSYPLHCDASKGSLEIRVSPLDRYCGDLFIYDEEGGIHDNDDTDAASTIEILNLDNEKLNHRRRAAIDAFRYLPGDTNWDEELDLIYNFQTTGKFAEFCFVLESYIRNYKL